MESTCVFRVSEISPVDRMQLDYVSKMSKVGD